MHVLFGLVMMVAALWGARALDGATVGSFGHIGTIVLVVLGPLGAAVMSHDFRTLVNGVKRLAEALAGRAPERRKRTLSECYEVGRAMRAGKPLEASQILQASRDPLLRQSAPLVLLKGSGAELAETVAILSYERLAEISSAEGIFSALSRATPAFGLIGTILGLVDMLRALKDFDKLGPGMALAVMSTFYGLLLSQALFVPLAKVIERHGQDTAVTAELLGRALSAIADGRALSEVRVLGGDGKERIANGAGTEDVA
jgi:chemotaxis protein MotA